MARGGKREGAGRKPGSVSKLARQAREEAAKTGELPHEFLLRVARGEKIGSDKPTLALRLDAAKAAAPYYAPKLATQQVHVSGPNGGPVQTSVQHGANMTADEFERIARKLMDEV